MRTSMTIYRLFLFFALLCLSATAHAQSFPKLTGRVVDNANLLDPAQEQALTAKLQAIEDESGRQVVIATLPDQTVNLQPGTDCRMLCYLREPSKWRADHVCPADA